MNIRPIPISKEHGAWVVLASAWLLGIVYARGGDIVPIMLTALVALSAVVLLESQRALIRCGRVARLRTQIGHYTNWSILSAFIAMIAAIPLLTAVPRLLAVVIPSALIFGLYALLEYRRAPMMVLSAVGFVGMALLAPATAIAAGSSAGWAELAGLWVVSALFFSTSVFRIKVRLNGFGALMPTAAFHTLVVGVAGILVIAEVIPIGGFIAVVPAVALLGWIAFDLDRYRAWPLKRIGLLESVIAAGFVLMQLLR